MHGADAVGDHFTLSLVSTACCLLVFMPTHIVLSWWLFPPVFLNCILSELQSEVTPSKAKEIKDDDYSARLKSVAYPKPLPAGMREDWRDLKQELAEVCEGPRERCKILLRLMGEDDVLVSGWAAPFLNAPGEGGRCISFVIRMSRRLHNCFQHSHTRPCSLLCVCGIRL